jgi:hypothetical protein
MRKSLTASSHLLLLLPFASCLAPDPRAEKNSSLSFRAIFQMLLGVDLLLVRVLVGRRVDLIMNQQ